MCRFETYKNIFPLLYTYVLYNALCRRSQQQMLLHFKWARVCFVFSSSLRISSIHFWLFMFMCLFCVSLFVSLFSLQFISFEAIKFWMFHLNGTKESKTKKKKKKLAERCIKLCFSFLFVLFLFSFKKIIQNLYKKYQYAHFVNWTINFPISKRTNRTELKLRSSRMEWRRWANVKRRCE